MASIEAPWRAFLHRLDILDIDTTAVVFEEGMVICVETPYYEIGYAGLQVEEGSDRLEMPQPSAACAMWPMVSGL